MYKHYSLCLITSNPIKQRVQWTAKTCVCCSTKNSPTRKETSYSDQTLTFASHPHKKKKKSEGCPPNQVCAAAVTSASDEKWRTFTCFFQSDRAKDLSALLYFSVWWMYRETRWRQRVRACVCVRARVCAGACVCARVCVRVSVCVIFERDNKCFTDILMVSI